MPVAPVAAMAFRAASTFGLAALALHEPPPLPFRCGCRLSHSPSTPSSSPRRNYYGSRGTYFADVTGDGKADAIVVNEDTITIRRSNGNEFTPNEDWTRGKYYGSRGTYFADATGDGRADAIVVNDPR